MKRYSEQDFLNKIKTMLDDNSSYTDISYASLEIMNSSIGWREEFRDFALDLINIIEPEFSMKKK